MTFYERPKLNNYSLATISLLLSSHCIILNRSCYLRIFFFCLKQTWVLCFLSQKKSSLLFFIDAFVHTVIKQELQKNLILDKGKV